MASLLKLCQHLMLIGLMCNYICLSNQLDSKGNNFCSNLHENFQQIGIDVTLSRESEEGQHSQVCGSSLTCCTDELLGQLSANTVEEFQSKVEKLSHGMKSAFHKKYKKFDDFFEELLMNAQTTMDNMFIDTYGDLYSVNSQVFMKLFQDLKAYYRGSLLDVDEIFDNFFTEVMQKVFELIHDEYHFDGDYKRCIADNMETIKPFANTPSVLILQFRRSFVAARAFVRGLYAGRNFAGRAARFHPSPQCETKLVAMTHCAACQGGVVVKPCMPLCRGVLNGCLVEYRNLTLGWEAYIDGLRDLLLRLEGPFNIEAVLEPFEVKLSEAVMMLQENKQEIDAAVFRECGIPKRRGNSTSLAAPSSHNLSPSYFQPYDEAPSRSRRSASQDQESGGRRKRRKSAKERKERHLGRSKGSRNSEITISHKFVKPKIEESRYRYSKGRDEVDREKQASAKTALGTNLSSLLASIKRTLSTYDHHWRELPNRICEKVAQHDASATCWNGASVDRHPVDDETLQQEVEVRIGLNHVSAPYIADHLRGLNKAVQEMKQGFKGLDFLLPPSDDEDEYNSGEGSGVDYAYKFADPSTETTTSAVIEQQQRTVKTTTTTTKRDSGGCCGSSATSYNSMLIGCLLLLAFLT